MVRKRYKPEGIVANLRQVDVLVAQGLLVVDAVRSIGVTDFTYYLWRSELGGPKTDQVKRMKDLELENQRLRKAVSDLTPFTLVNTPGDLSIVNSLSYRSESSQFETPLPLLDQEESTLWDLSLIFRSEKGWSIGVHGKNLTDERYKVAGYNFVTINPTFGVITPTLGREGTLTAFYGDPRTWWASLTTEF